MSSIVATVCGWQVVRRDLVPGRNTSNSAGQSLSTHRVKVDQHLVQDKGQWSTTLSKFLGRANALDR